MKEDRTEQSNPTKRAAPETMTDLPQITLSADATVGLYVHYDKTQAEELSECLEADGVQFAFNPPEAAHLAQADKAVFVFGRKHPRVVAEWLELIGEEVVIAPDVAIPEGAYKPPADQLLLLGEPSSAEERSYAALGLSTADFSELVRMATDEELHGGPQESAVVYAPVHAWRALAQLGATEAIVPLVELLPRADDWDGWVSDDLPKALAQFGAAAIEPASHFLADATRGDWARVAAAKTLGEMGKTQPARRLDAIGRLSAQLERFAEQSETLNAMLVAELWDLNAVEAMPVIERAFASGRVDESVTGDVENVQIHFGLKTQREYPRKPNRLTELGEKFRAQWQAAGLPLPDADGDFPEPLAAGDDLFEPDTEPPAIAIPYIAPPKIGRNDPCPCGSGKKYKKCCGR